MSMRLLAALFIALFLIGIYPALFVQPFGSASAGITAGFLSLVQNSDGVTGLIVTGVVAAWLAAEMVLLLPVTALLMFVIGALTEIDVSIYHALHAFILGGILLFALTISLLRKKIFLLYITPVSIWAFFVGGSFMHNVPSITTPLFYMIGTVVGCALVLATSVTLGITFSDKMQEWSGRFKASSAYSSFLSLF